MVVVDGVEGYSEEVIFGVWDGFFCNENFEGGGFSGGVLVFGRGGVFDNVEGGKGGGKFK